MRERGRMPHSQGQGFCDLPLAVGMGNPFSLPAADKLRHWSLYLPLTARFVGGGVVGDMSTAAYSRGVTELLDPQPFPPTPVDLPHCLRNQLQLDSPRNGGDCIRSCSVFPLSTTV
jgi:hypothetical protein